MKKQKRSFFLAWAVLFLTAGSSLAKISVPFEGQFDFLKKKYSFGFPLGEKGNISTQWTQSSQDKFDVSINIDHLQHSLLDLTTDLFGSVKIINKDKDNLSLSGNVWSQNSLLNLKPSGEVSGSFEVKDKKLFFNSISLGTITCQGYVDLSFPFKLNVTLTLTQLDLENFLETFLEKDDIDAAGTVSGKIQLTGEIGYVSLKGQLHSEGGKIDQWEYSSMDLNVEGAYPFIYLSDSQIAQLDGTVFTIEGPLNLADRQNFSKQFERLTKSPLVNVDGSQKEWTFKRVKAEEESSTTELKYLLRENKTPGSEKEGTDMFGLEQTIEF